MRAIGRSAAVAAAVVAADQVTKAIVRSSVERGERVEVLGFVDIVNVRNRGIAFGLFADGGAMLVVVTAAAALAVIAFLVTHTGRPLVWLPTGLLLGGAAGNLLDRAREGSVTDFVDLPYWPAFNLADSAITIGVISLLYVLEGPPRRRDKAARSAPGDAQRQEPTA